MRLGAYLGLIENCFKTQLTYRLNLVVDTLNPFVSLAIMWFVWKAIFASSPTPVIAGYTFSAMITYAAISSIISSYTWMNTEFDVQNEVKSGSIVAILIKPLSYPFYRFAIDTGGTTTWLLLTKLPIIAFAFAILGISGPASPLFFVSALLGYLVNYLMVFLTALWCFWTIGDVWGVKFARQMISNVVSGALVPLTFFPLFLQDAFNLLPFQAVFYAPLSIYIGTVSGYAALAVIATQLAWIGIMFALTYAAWHFTVKRVVVQGG